ncbi:MAG: ATP-dependent 6-phosphofructokinase [Planctomycetes bacterium]|nr:ATP-dependent 6-phosphofructokinase [Planctomycetota bacterium]MCC7395456.1 ATP-dependent 6-phosphofructokinase [Planctomycetota bacterium]
MRVGVMTGGGDAPGLNAAICGLGRRLIASGAELIGFEEGWRGLIEDKSRPLHDANFQHLLVYGGTLLGSSGDNPYRDPSVMVPKVLATIARHRLDALVAIGGEGTLGAADRLFTEHAVPVVGVPKTIDNDLDATDFTFGFFSAVEVATRAMDDLRSTAESHSRVIVVECMGRHAGWITAYAGVAAGAEAVLVPERPAHIEELCENLQRLRRSGARSAIVAVAEGTRVFEGKACLSSMEKDEFGEYKTGGIAATIARRIQGRIGWDARPLVLGHLQRAGKPIAFDRIFALRLGARAARLVLERRFGLMAAMRAGEIVDVPLHAAVAARKTLTDQFLDRYESFFLPVGGP